MWTASERRLKTHSYQLVRDIIIIMWGTWMLAPYVQNVPRQENESFQRHHHDVREVTATPCLSRSCSQCLTTVARGADEIPCRTTVNVFPYVKALN